MLVRHGPRGNGANPRSAPEIWPRGPPEIRETAARWPSIPRWCCWSATTRRPSSRPPRRSRGGGSGASSWSRRPPASARRASWSRRRQDAREQGMRVLAGRGSELESTLPVRHRAPALRARAVRGRARAARDSWLAGAADLARPMFEDVTAVDATETDDATFPRLHGLYWLAANVCPREPAARRRRRRPLVRRAVAEVPLVPRPPPRGAADPVPARDAAGRRGAQPPPPPAHRRPERASSLRLRAAQRRRGRALGARGDVGRGRRRSSARPATPRPAATRCS